MVTWCKLDEDKIEGAKLYVSDNTKPKMAEKSTELEAAKVSLNLPW